MIFSSVVITDTFILYYLHIAQLKMHTFWGVKIFGGLKLLAEQNFKSTFLLDAHFLESKFMNGQKFGVVNIEESNCLGS